MKLREGITDFCEEAGCRKERLSDLIHCYEHTSLGKHAVYVIQSDWIVVDDDDYGTTHCEDKINHYLVRKDGGYHIKTMCYCSDGIGRRFGGPS